MKHKLSLVALAAGLLLSGCEVGDVDSEKTSDVSEKTSVVENSVSADASVSHSTDSQASVGSQASESTSEDKGDDKDPVTITMTADKTSIAKGDKAIVTVTTANTDEVIEPVVSDDSLLEAVIVKNDDGTFTVRMDEDSNYGGIVSLKASTADGSAGATLDLRFYTPISDAHVALLDKAFDRTLSGAYTDGTAIASAAYSFEKATDGDYYLVGITTDKWTGKFFSNYDSKFNEVHFQNVNAYKAINDKYLNALTIKLHSDYIEVSNSSFNVAFGTDVPLAEDKVNLTVKGYAALTATTNVAKLGDQILMSLLSSSTDKLTYSFSITKGADYVTLNDFVDLDDLVDDTKRYVTVKNDEAGYGQAVEVKAAVTNGTVTVDKFFSFTIEDRPTEGETVTMDDSMKGVWTWENNGCNVTLTVTDSDTITISDAYEYEDDAVLFTATDITVIEPTKIKFNLSNEDKADGDNFKNGEEVTIKLEDDGTMYVRTTREYGVDDWFNTAE